MLKIFYKNKTAFLGASFIFFITLSSVFAPIMSAYSFDMQDTENILGLPDLKHWMGTDRLGRDLFSRILFGARVSLFIGFFSTLTAMLIGTLYGAISGYVGGKIDNIMMRVVDVVFSLPDLLLIILITVTIGRGVGGIFFALSMVSWATVARLVRGETLRLKEYSYVEAARALGLSHRRIILKYILPNTIGLLIVTLTFRIPLAILAESTLSFIGLGIAPPFSSWGSLANEGWTALKFYPHLIIFPSVVIFLTILSFNFIGEGLRDILDPEGN